MNRKSTEQFNREYAAFVDEIKAEAALAQAIAKANEAIEEVRVCKERLIVAKQSNEEAASEHPIERSEVCSKATTNLGRRNR